MKKPRRLWRLTLERERTFIFRSRSKCQLGWCERCAAEVELMSIPDAAREIGLSELVIYQIIESGGQHFVREADVNILVCLESLRLNQRQLENLDTNKLGGGSDESND